MTIPCGAVNQSGIDLIIVILLCDGDIINIHAEYRQEISVGAWIFKSVHHI